MIVDREVFYTTLVENQGLSDLRYLRDKIGELILRKEKDIINVFPLSAEESRLIQIGKKIQAIKLIKKRSGLSLRDVKDIADTYLT